MRDEVVRLLATKIGALTDTRGTGASYDYSATQCPEGVAIRTKEGLLDAFSSTLMAAGYTVSRVRGQVSVVASDPYGWTVDVSVPVVTLLVTREG